jgi:hypothetical protein
MITPEHMVGAIRHDLATRVLPAITDDRARSSVIAAMGILGDLALQIREDDGWVAEAVGELRAGVARWPVSVPRDASRSELLAIVEELVARLWAEGGHEKLLRDVRAVLRADLAHQLKRIR